jgi:glycosidase
MITPKLKKSVWVVLAAAALTACGGGGGSSSGSDTPAPEPTPTPTPVAEVTQATAVSQFAAKFDDQINQFSCFKGENKDKCGLILYQVMVEAAPNGGDAAGKGTGWGPSEHKGTLKGIENSLDFIKGSGANALWITPVFTTSTTGDDGVKKTSATGYYASKYWEGDDASIDPDFGGLSSFKSLVSKTHEKDMLFILDGVFGHAKNDIVSSIGGVSPVKSAKCINKNGSQDDAGSFMTCFDWNSADTNTFFKNLAANMITKYDIDGWRLDQAYQVPRENWSKISSAVKSAATSGRSGAGYMVAEVWSSKENIEKTVFKDAAIESAFNFPLRYKLVQVLAGQEDTTSDEATMREASFIANPWGYGSMADYTNHNVMPNMFLDNHDVLRFGNLLFRNNIVSESDVASAEYSLRHLQAFAFEMAYSGPITIYYGSEYGDWTRDFSQKLSDTVCGKQGKCDDHASRTQMVKGEDDLEQWQKDLRTNVGKMMSYRKDHPALYNGYRFHIYSTEDRPSDRNSANFYVDVKKAADGSEAFVFVASMSRKDRTLQFNEDLTKYLCQKAKGADSCALDLVMDTSKPDVMSTDSVLLEGSTFAFEMPALSARLFKVK